MAKSLFSVPIFFIVFRETLEAAIIVSVLLGLVEQLVLKESLSPVTEGSDTDSKSGSRSQSHPRTGLVEDDTILRRRLLRTMRIKVRRPSAPMLQYIFTASCRYSSVLPSGFSSLCLLVLRGPLFYP